MFTPFQSFADLRLKNYPFFLISRIRAYLWKIAPFFTKVGTSMVYLLIRSGGAKNVYGHIVLFCSCCCTLELRARGISHISHLFTPLMLKKVQCVQGHFPAATSSSNEGCSVRLWQQLPPYTGICKPQGSLPPSAIKICCSGVSSCGGTLWSKERLDGDGCSRSSPVKYYILRNGTVVVVTAIVFTGDVEACLQRLLWRPGQSFWQHLRFSISGMSHWSQTTSNSTVLQFGHSSSKIKTPHALLAFCEENPPVIGRTPSQSTSDAETEMAVPVDSTVNW